MAYLSTEGRGTRIGFGVGAGLVALGAMTCLVAFIAFASIWQEDYEESSAKGSGPTDARNYRNQTRTEYAYYGAVILMLALLVLFNGYHTYRLAL